MNAHTCTLPVQLDASQLVSAVFSVRLRPLAPGDVLRTQAGKFHVETVVDAPGDVQVVLVTGAPGLDARFGIAAEASPGGSSSVVLYTSVHPWSWVGRFYYRLIEPFHHVLMEQLLLRRLRRRAHQLTRGAEA
ncbi:MAG: DUF2867 domain-containing protein [Dehalococcoidia bacterium]